jgi:hypothetical protein
MHLMAVTQREHNVKLTPGGVAYGLRDRCKSGRHEWKPENFIAKPNGARYCKLCRREQANRKYAEFRARNPLPEQTHCKHGHQLSGDNLVIRQKKKGPMKECRECTRLRTKAYRIINYDAVVARKRERRARDRNAQR